MADNTKKKKSTPPSRIGHTINVTSETRAIVKALAALQRKTMWEVAHDVFSHEYEKHIQESAKALRAAK